MILGVQIIAIIFGIFMLYVTFLHLKRKEFTSKESGAWFIIWISFTFISIFPTILDIFIKEVLQLSRRLDFFIIVSIIFMLGVLFYMYGIVRSTQKSVEKVVRECSITDAKKDYPKKKR